MTKWQQRYKVHPSADVFPMMSGEELDELGDDIKAHGLKEPVKFYQDGDTKVLLDARNRLEAMERVGIDPGPDCFAEIDTSNGFDPVAYIISLNIHRRHLNKTQQANLILAAINAGEQVSRQDGDKPKKGGRTKSDLKAEALATGKKHGISPRTMERALADAVGKTKTNRPKSAKPEANLDAARQRYLKQCEGPEVDIEQEYDTVIDALIKISKRRNNHNSKEQP